MGGVRGGILFNDQNKKDFRRFLRNNMPIPEVILWSKLKGRQLGSKFRRQYSIDSYVLDFYCPSKRLAVEIDGDSHYSCKARVHDKLRNDFLESKKIKTLRFTNKEIIKELDQVLLKILKAIS